MYGQCICFEPHLYLLLYIPPPVIRIQSHLWWGIVPLVTYNNDTYTDVHSTQLCACLGWNKKQGWLVIIAIRPMRQKLLQYRITVHT